MRKLWTVSCAVLAAAAIACAQGTPEKRAPEAPKPPQVETDPAVMQDTLKRGRETVARWESTLAKARAEDYKKYLADAVAKGKTAMDTLEKAIAAQAAGKADDARQLGAQARTQQTDFFRALNAARIWSDVDRATAIKEDFGKDNPELAARCQKVIDLSKKRVELQNQLAALEAEVAQELRAMVPPPPAAPKKPDAKPTEAKPADAK